jgi:hypothetical protein
VTACPKKWSQSLSCMLREDLSWCWIKSPCCVLLCKYVCLDDIENTYGMRIFWQWMKCSSCPQFIISLEYKAV